MSVSPSVLSGLALTLFCRVLTVLWMSVSVMIMVIVSTLCVVVPSFLRVFSSMSPVE